MNIVYFDQNKWIQLAQAWKRPTDYPEIKNLLIQIESSVSSGQLCLPLTAANIYETFKINDKDRRGDLAFIQSKFSGGRVFVGRYERLAKEIAIFFHGMNTKRSTSDEKQWFLSKIFFEAFTAHDDERSGLSISPKLLKAMGENPAYFLHDYMMRLI